MDDDLFAIFARVSVACSCSVCVEVWHILFALISLLYSGHYKDSTLLLWYAISRQIFCS